jgi:hypothetical protein
VLKVGRATVVCVVDWEKDGDLDLVVGDIEGNVNLVRNASGGKALAYSKVEKLAAAGEKISAPGRNSGPVVTDWDGDGKDDLLVGCGDGSVLWFRNTSEDGKEPVLAAGEVLLPASSSWRATGEEEARSPHGYRAKLAVADWNGDGKKDLLVGDYKSEVGPEPDLTAEQVEKRDALTKSQAELQRRLQPYYELWRTKYEEWYAKAREELGMETETPWREFLGNLSDEGRQKLFEVVRGYQAEDPKWAEYMKLQQEIQKIYQELRPFQAPRTSHGYVWLYVRK